MENLNLANVIIAVEMAIIIILTVMFFYQRHRFINYSIRQLKDSDTQDKILHNFTKQIDEKDELIRFNKELAGIWEIAYNDIIERYKSLEILSGQQLSIIENYISLRKTIDEVAEEEPKDPEPITDTHGLKQVKLEDLQEGKLYYIYDISTGKYWANKGNGHECDYNKTNVDKNNKDFIKGLYAQHNYKYYEVPEVKPEPVKDTMLEEIKADLTGKYFYLESHGDRMFKLMTKEKYGEEPIWYHKKNQIYWGNNYNNQKLQLTNGSKKLYTVVK